MIRINANQQEVEYRGILFPFNKIKQTIRRVVPHELLRDHCIKKKFNPKTGEIEYKYAFGAVFEDLAELGILQEILDDIIEDEDLTP